MPETKPSRIQSQARTKLIWPGGIFMGPGLFAARSVNQVEKFEHHPAEGCTGGQVHDVVLFGVKTTQGDERRKRKDRGAETRKQMQRGERGDGSVQIGRA